jgi:putative aldouronate transport system substrate-binding protein
MKKPIARTLALLFSVMMIATALVACTPGASPQASGTEQTQTVQPAQTVEPTPTPEKTLEDYPDVMKVSCLVTGYYGGPANGTDTELYKLIKDRYKIDLSDWEWTTGDPGLQKASMYVASGDMPDAIIFGPEPAYKTKAKQIADQFVDAGIVMDIEPYLANTPNIMKYLSSEILQAFRSKDGKLYMLPSYTVKPDLASELTVEVVTVLYARTDWLKQLNLEPPKTTDEFYAMLKAFQTLPDVNGKKVIPFAPLWNGDAIQSDIGGMFGIWNYRMAPKDDEQRMMDMYETPNYLNYLKFASKLFREGLIYQETYSTSWEKIYNEMMPGGYVGCGTMWSPNISDSEAALKKVAPDGDYEVIPLPKAPGVDKTELAQVNTLGNIYTLFSKKISDPERLFKLLDWMCSREGWPYIAYGAPSKEKGEWYIDESGKTVYDASHITDFTKDNPKYKQDVLGEWCYGLAGVLKFTPDLIFDVSTPMNEHRAAAHQLYANDIFMNPLYDLYSMQDAGPVGQARNADLAKLYTESETNIIMTAADDAAVETMYNKMMDDANKSGRLDVLKEQYQTYLKVKQMMGK